MKWILIIMLASTTLFSCSLEKLVKSYKIEIINSKKHLEAQKQVMTNQAKLNEGKRELEKANENYENLKNYKRKYYEN